MLTGCQKDRKTERQADRQSNRQKDGQTERKTDRSQIDRQTHTNFWEKYNKQLGLVWEYQWYVCTNAH